MTKKKHEELVGEIPKELMWRIARIIVAVCDIGHRDALSMHAITPEPIVVPDFEAKSVKQIATEIIGEVLSAVRDGRLGGFKEALEAAQHELATLHGLYACDGFHAYGEAQQAGLDAVGAWGSFVDSTWQIDVSQATEAIGSALRKEEK